MLDDVQSKAAGTPGAAGYLNQARAALNQARSDYYKWNTTRISQPPTGTPGQFASIQRAPLFHGVPSLSSDGVATRAAEWTKQMKQVVGMIESMNKSNQAIVGKDVEKELRRLSGRTGAKDLPSAGANDSPGRQAQAQVDSLSGGTVQLLRNPYDAGGEGHAPGSLIGAGESLRPKEASPVESSWLPAPKLKAGHVPEIDSIKPDLSPMNPGDILLVGPTGKSGAGIQAADASLSPEGGAPASHTVQFIKEVKGKRLYLDGQLSDDWSGYVTALADPLVGGVQVITEDEVVKRYSDREMRIAQLKKPLDEKQQEAVLGEAIRMQRDVKYRVVGDGLVCSEINNGVLNAAGVDIRQRLPNAWDSSAWMMQQAARLGIGASPADVYHDRYNFNLLDVKRVEK
ncbi:MAG: hypothetical protein R6X19_09365 [Kiritimatiellia bacterium]